MTLLNKLFCINENGTHYVFHFFGIKLKNHVRADLITFRQSFLWENEDKLTTKEKKWYLETYIYQFARYFPNLKVPRSINEKINWMKLNYNNSLQRCCVDKYEFKKYIAEKLGNGYTIPLIGVYKDVNDIDFKTLPKQFVIKSTVSGAGKGVRVIKNNETLDIDKLKYNFNLLLQDWKSMYYSSFGAAYKGIKPQIIIEEYIPKIAEMPCEYKIFCFNGEPKMLYTINYHKKEWTYYDMNLNRIPVTNSDYGGSLKMSPNKVLKPSKNFNKMIEISKILAKDFALVRVDFYDIEDKLYIGELTFTPTGGFAKYTPREYDYEFGEFLDLSKIPEENLQILPEFAEGAKTFIAPDVVDRCTVRNS